MKSDILPQSRGFTLVELLIVVIIMVIVIVALMQVFTYCAQLAEAARNLSIATNEAQERMERMRNHGFANLCADFNGTTENLNQLDGTAFIYIDDEGGNPCSGSDTLLQADVIVTWENSNGRIYGEDIDQNGVLDFGEDTDGDGRMSSRVVLRTYFAKR